MTLELSIYLGNSLMKNHNKKFWPMKLNFIFRYFSCLLKWPKSSSECCTTAEYYWQKSHGEFCLLTGILSACVFTYICSCSKSIRKLSM